MSDPTPLEVVQSKFELPLTPRELQAGAINKLAPLSRTGLYAEVGTGKTLMGTVICLFKLIVGRNTTLVLMPPILLVMWYRWLSRIPGVTVTLYKGTPKQRREIPLTGNFILMSLGVFKNDYDYLYEMFEHVPLTGMVDEATSIKNGGVSTKASGNYKMVKSFFEGRDLLLMTGTPLSTPGDAYAYVKLVSPSVYRNVRHFEAIHVEERDFFEKVVKWGQLEFLAENLLLNSVRLLKREALPDLREPQYLPMPYDLDPAHARLYKQLADEQILLLENGGKIDATVEQVLYNMLQQIVCNPGHFSGDPSMYSAAHAVIDSIVDQVGVGKAGGSKLLIAANYKMTNRGLLQYLAPYGAVAIYGEVSAKMKDVAVDRFVNDPTCGICIVNPVSGGLGLDGFQTVCNDVLFPELPRVPKDFHQTVGRLDRDGQRFVVNVHMPFALGTIQVKLKNDLLVKDALVNRVARGWKDLKDAIYGVS